MMDKNKKSPSWLNEARQALNEYRENEAAKEAERKKAQDAELAKQRERDIQALNNLLAYLGIDQITDETHVDLDGGYRIQNARVKLLMPADAPAAPTIDGLKNAHRMTEAQRQAWLDEQAALYEVRLAKWQAEVDRVEAMPIRDRVQEISYTISIHDESDEWQAAIDYFDNRSYWDYSYNLQTSEKLSATKPNRNWHLVCLAESIEKLNESRQKIEALYAEHLEKVAEAEREQAAASEQDDPDELPADPRYNEPPTMADFLESALLEALTAYIDRKVDDAVHDATEAGW